MMKQTEQTKDNIIKHPGKPKITFFTVLLFLSVIFLGIQGIRFATRKSLQAYSIGAPETDRKSGSFTGIILRDETLYTAERDGFATYYAGSGERVSNGEIICTIDSDGQMAERIHELYYGQEILSNRAKSDILSAIRRSVNQYDPDDFRTAYLAKAEIQSAVLTGLLKDGGEDLFSRLAGVSYAAVYAPESGFSVFWCDGLENLNPEDLTASDFQEKRSQEMRTNGTEISAGDFLYKRISDNSFRLVFPLDEDTASQLAGRTVLTVLTEGGIEMSGSFSETVSTDGTKLGVLTFSKYGGNFLNDRYLKFELIDRSVTGYKIPESAVTEKTFFVVGTEFITEGGANHSKGLLVQNDGEARFVPCTVYERSTEDNVDNFIIGENTAYVAGSELQYGMTLIGQKVNSEGGTDQVYGTLTATVSQEGVYQINNGYAVFKPIVRLKNSIDTDFCMISHRVRYGIAPFDRILLNVDDVNENDIVVE